MGIAAFILYTIFIAKVQSHPNQKQPGRRSRSTSIVFLPQFFIRKMWHMQPIPPYPNLTDRTGANVPCLGDFDPFKTTPQ